MKSGLKRTMVLFFAVMIAAAFSPVGAFAEEAEHVHSWSGWTESYAPTCGDTGTEVQYCTECGETVERSIPATGNHDWDEWEVVKKATVFKKGKKERTCYVCDKVQTKAIPKVKPFAKFKKKTYKLKIGKSLALKSRLKFGKGDKVKKWKTSNKKVATINSKGKIKAKRTGTVKITAKMKSGKKAVCKVKVTVPKKKSSSGSSAKKQSGGNTVYWVENGDVYHSTPNCSTLSRSRNIYSGSLSSCPKSRPCKRCH